LKKIVNIQKSVLRYVFKDYSSSYRGLRQKANKPLLYVQRLRPGIEVYKIVNKIGPKYLSEMFNFRELSYDLRNSYTIIPFNYNTMNHGKQSIRYVGAKLWNMLSNEPRGTMNFIAFKRFVIIWQRPNYTCLNCGFCSFKQM